MQSTSEMPASSSRKKIEKRRKEREEKAEQARIRTGYRTLISESSDARTSLVQADSDGIAEALVKTNELYASVSRPREALLDAEAINLFSAMGVEQVNKLSTESNNYNAAEFTRHVRQFLRLGSLHINVDAEQVGDEDDDDEDDGGVVVMNGRTRSRNQPATQMHWRALGESVAGSFRVVKVAPFMNGSLRLEAKIRKVSQRAKDNFGAVVKPGELNTREDVEQQTADAVANVLNQILDKVNNNPEKYAAGIPFDQLILNPQSFSQTIENLFYLSFLSKEGMVKEVTSDTSPIPLILPAEKPQAADHQSGASFRKQHIVRMDMRTWKVMRKIHRKKKREIILPHRSLAKNSKKTSRKKQKTITSMMGNGVVHGPSA